MHLKGRNLTQGLTGADVAELHTELIALGFTIPPAEQQAASFGPDTLAAVQKFQAQQGLAVSGVVEAATAAKLSAIIVLNTYTVSGTITDPVSAAVGGLTVELVDRNIGADTSLTSGSTDLLGTYRLNVVITPQSLSVHHKTKPDLQVHVSAGTTFLAASSVVYDAPSIVSIDVTLPPDTIGLPSEHETFIANVATLYPDKLGALNEEHQDITFVARKSKLDARLVAMLALADQLGDIYVAPAPGAPSVNLKPELYYALLRAGFPANADSLFQASPKAVEAVWQQAIKQRVIPQSLSGEIARAVQIFTMLSAAQMLAPGAKPPIGISNLHAMLQASMPDATPQREQQFARLYSQYREDMPAFWSGVESAFGAAAAEQFKLYGQFLELTKNNAPLVVALNAAESRPPLKSTLDLAARGYYSADKWLPLIGNSIPPQVPGSGDAQRNTYAELLATQVRLAFPTAVVSHLVRSDTFKLSDPVQQGPVADFLAANQGKFEIGMEPIKAYLARVPNLPSASAKIVDEITRLQRVYQMTTEDGPMAVLLEHKLDSASDIARYDAAGFTRAFQTKLGGANIAAKIHARAKQIHAAVLNVAVWYLGSRIAPRIGSNSPILRPGPPTPGTSPPPIGGQSPALPVTASQVDTSYPIIAYPTLEGLFGSLDFCSCQECRSILSPAAYLVDLLSYLDQPSPTQGYQNPQSVLFQRRPDLQFLPLTCENTNKALPYIDLVNETLEYFVANKSLAGYQGHDTGDIVASNELMANPQYVNDAAYTALQNVYFPPPLPFNRPLELLRLHLEKLGVVLPELMAALRTSEAIDRDSPAHYGWRDILMETLAISRDEYALFTDSTKVNLGALYGYADSSSALTGLQTMSLQVFSRRTLVSYDDLFSLVKTEFINPSAVLIPRLEQLGASFATLQSLSDPDPAKAAANAAAFKAALPFGLDARQYGGLSTTDHDAVVNWVKTNLPRITGIITITNPNPVSAVDQCSGDALQFRYTNPDNTANELRATDFVKLIRFIRLWRKLRLTIRQTDELLSALFPASDMPSGTNDATTLPLLDQGFVTLLARAGFIFQIMRRLGLTPDSALSQLLACWAPIGTGVDRQHEAPNGGDAQMHVRRRATATPLRPAQASLYERMFLTPTLLQDTGPNLAMIADPISAGDVLTTTINTVPIAYTVQAGDTLATVATNIANAINATSTTDPTTTLPLNRRIHAGISSQPGAVVVKAGFTLACSVSPGATESYTTTGSSPLSRTATVSAASVTPGDVLTTTINNISILYIVVAGDTAATIADRIAATINASIAQDPFSGSPLNTLILATNTSGKITINAINFGAPFALACSLLSSDAASYEADAFSPPRWTATIGGTGVQPGDTLVTTINGVALPYVASASDTNPTMLASSIAAMINASTVTEPSSKLAVQGFVSASAEGAIVTLAAKDPTTPFTLACSVTHGVETYTAAGPLPASQLATVGGTFAANRVLIATINGIEILYQTIAGDTPVSIAANIASVINATATRDPATNLPLNDLLAAAAGPTETSGGRTIRSVVVTAKDPASTFTMTVSLVSGSYTAGSQASPFADDGYGNFLHDSSRTLLGYESPLCAACNLTGAEFALIAKELNFGASSPLSLPNVSAIFRYGWFAHTLRGSVQEILLLRRFSGLDPFAPLDPGSPPITEPPATRFIRLVQALRRGGLTPAQALYLIWNQDISGKSAPTIKNITGLARALRADLTAVEAQFAVAADPDGSIAKTLMALVYGNAVTDFFFGLLNNTLSVSISYSTPVGQTRLPQPIIDASKGGLDYDDLRKQLTYFGVLDSPTQTAIDQAITSSGNEYAPLHAKLGELASANQKAVAPFFSKYPELQTVYDAYVASPDPPATKRATLLNDFRPGLKHKRKQEQALASVTAAAGTDPSFASALLQDATVLHAVAERTFAAIVDFSALEFQGLSLALFLSNKLNATVDKMLDSLPLSSSFQTASVGGTINVNDILTTTINGLAIEYKVTATDVTLPVLAEHVAATINATILPEPTTNVPLNQLVFASPSGNLITVATFDPSGSGLSVRFSVSTGATTTYTATTGAPFAGIWSGYVEAPQDGFYAISVITDAAAVSLQIGDLSIVMAQSGTAWSNQSAISLTAGVLAPIVITATSIQNSLSVSWSSSPGIGSQTIPGQYLYSSTLVDRLRDTYVRFLKATSLANALSLTANEVAWLGAATSFAVNTNSHDKIAAGTNTFTPASMKNIKPGSKLLIDAGNAQETVTVVNTTATTFSTANNKPHDGTGTPFPIISVALPDIGRGWINFLAASNDPDAVTAASLTDVLMALLDYARMKQAFSPKDERLLTVLQSPAAVLANGKTALISLTGWDQTSLNALMLRFFGAADLSQLSSVETLRRISDAYAFVQTCRISAAALIAASTNAPSPMIVAALQSALRSLYAESDWLTVLRPINDTMRMRQRDALIAYILKEKGDEYEQSLIPATTAADAASGATTLSLADATRIKTGMQVRGGNVVAYTTVTAVAANNITISAGLLGSVQAGSNITFDPGTAPAIDTADKLFEYFLMDVETQPPVETSRIRFVLSIVQLFIERILRNLEPQICPADIDGSLWQWMKRFRVWQANREIFLWPENWLYPELRDDQSPFFQQTMSALLQGDITDDAAANAYLDYLTRLEEVAKLEPCGLYYSPQTNDENEICYVVARTAGTHRKYYFRTRENGSWKPWTEVKIDCEDMPITPIVWNGRLFLFWLKILKQTSPQPLAARTPLGQDSSGNPVDSGSPVAGVSLDNLQAFAQTGVQSQLQNSGSVSAVLCWTEFYNGKWQPTKTSDVNRPTSLGNFPLTGDHSFDVDRNLLRIVPVAIANEAPFDIPPETLILGIRDPIHALDPSGGSGFVLYNTHSLPVRIEDFVQNSIYLSYYLAPPARSRMLTPIQPYTGGNAVERTFSISYWTRATNGPLNYTRQIENLMQFNLIPRFVEPQPGLADAWNAPFFFEDRRSLFYVTTNATLGTVRGFEGFGILSVDPSLQGIVANIPPLVLPEQRAPSHERDPILTGSGRDGGSLTVQGYLSGPAAVRVAIGSVTPVPYQNWQISLSGSSAAPSSTPSAGAPS